MCACMSTRRGPGLAPVLAPVLARTRARTRARDRARGTSYLLLQTIAGLEHKLDPERFIRIHRSTILRRDHIRGLRHEGLGVWCAELADGEALRIGRTYLRKVKAMAGK